MLYNSAKKSSEMDLQGTTDEQSPRFVAKAGRTSGSRHRGQPGCQTSASAWHSNEHAQNQCTLLILKGGCFKDPRSTAASDGKQSESVSTALKISAASVLQFPQVRLCFPGSMRHHAKQRRQPHTLSLYHTHTHKHSSGQAAEHTRYGLV